MRLRYADQRRGKQDGQREWDEYVRLRAEAKKKRGTKRPAKKRAR